jgi:hypothetical protein
LGEGGALIIPLLGATPSVVLALSTTYRDRNKTLLIRRLPHVVARRAVVARQIDRSTTTGGRATDVGRGLPDHLGVMTGRIPIRFRENRAAVPLCFFVDPALH